MSSLKATPIHHSEDFTLRCPAPVVPITSQGEIKFHLHLIYKLQTSKKAQKAKSKVLTFSIFFQLHQASRSYCVLFCKNIAQQNLIG